MDMHAFVITRHELAVITVYLLVLICGTPGLAAPADATHRKVTIHKALGDIYEKLGNTRDALQEYQAWVELAPGDVEAYIALGNLLYRNREYSSAAVNYRKAANLEPNNMDYRGRLQDAESADGKFHPAKDTSGRNYPVGDFGPDPAPSGSKEQPWKAK